MRGHPWALAAGLCLALAWPAMASGADEDSQERSPRATGAAEPEPGGGGATGERRRRSRVPLIESAGAWEWVEGIFLRLMEAAEMTPHVPTPEQRAILSGKVEGEPPPLSRDQGHATLLLIRSPEVNAFVTSTRLLVVTQGLLEFVGSDDELAGVMAHEVGHFQGAHIRRVSAKSTLLGLLGTLAGALAGEGEGALAGQAIGRMAGLGYNRAAEFDADRRSVALMRAAGYHPSGMLTFMERLREEHSLELRDPLSVFFSTHPPSHQRAARLRRMIDATPGRITPRGLSFHFRREIYGMRKGSVDTAMARTLGTTPTAIDFEALGREAGGEAPAPPLLRVRLGSFQRLPEGFTVESGAVAPVSEGVLLGPGAAVRGPLVEVDPKASYILSAEVRAVGGRSRGFLGLELHDAAGERVGVVYPGESGTFLEEGAPTRLTGLSHPFARREACQGTAPTRGRLVLAAGEIGAGRLLIRELGLSAVGAARARDTVSEP